jgi:recombinational DNA repair ATPase RecF
MRLSSATLRNYRMHRELSVRFDPARTVIGGPNEAGKSTLVHAIHRALFYRHKSDVDLDAIRSRTISSPPEVVVEFEVAGRGYVVHKVFNGTRGSSATLTDLTTGEKLAGEDAETRLRELLGVDDVHHTKLDRQWAHLWVRQGSAAKDPTSPEVLNDYGVKLRGKLSVGSDSNVNESDRDSSTYKRIAAASRETFGAKAVVLKSSELGVAMAEVASARSAVAEAAGTLQSLEDAADVIVRQDATIQACKQTLDEATRDLAQAEADRARIETEERTLERRSNESRTAADAYSALADGDAAIRDVERTIVALQESLVPQEQEVNQLLVHERRAQEGEAKAAAALTTAVDQQREALIESDLLQVLERAFDLSARRLQIEHTIAQSADHESEIARLDSQLQGLPDIGKEHVDELTDLEQRLGFTRGKLQAIATRIEVLSANTVVSLAGETLESGAEKTLTEAAELVVGGGTTIRVTPGGGQTLADVRLAMSELESLLGSKLAAIGLQTVAEARSSLEARMTAASLRKQIAATLADLRVEESRAELRRTAAAVEAVEAEIARKLPADRPRPADAAALEAAREQAKIRQADAVKTFQQAQEDFDEARQALNAAAQRRTAAEAAIATSKGELQGLEGRKKTLQERFAGDREQKLRELAANKKAAEEAVLESERLLSALGPERVRSDVDRLTRAMTAARQQITEARERQAEARGLLQSSGMTDLHGAKATADARLEMAERRHAELDRRSRAIELLRTLFETRRQTLSEALATPLRNKVAEYLDELHRGGTRVEVSVTQDGVADLKVARPVAGGLPFAFDALSGGTKEQVAAACRLAMAEILAGSDGCLPVVFDDAFTNSDPERIRGVLRVLELGAKRGLQIIVLSCNPHEYGLFGASRVDLPPARFDATPGTAAPAWSAVPDSGDADDTYEASDQAAREGAPAGEVPIGDDGTLATLLMAAVESMPEQSVGNKTLRERLGWDERTYERIKDRLVDEGRLEKGRGRGGSVRLPAFGTSETP